MSKILNLLINKEDNYIYMEPMLLLKYRLIYHPLLNTILYGHSALKIFKFLKIMDLILSD